MSRDEREAVRYQAILELRRAIERLRERNLDGALDEIGKASANIHAAKGQQAPS